MSTDAQVWQANAEDLTDHVLARLANRVDTFGGYRPDGTVTTPKKTLTAPILTGHFCGKWAVGLHALSQHDTCKWIALDIDNHNGGNPGETEMLAIQLYHFLDELDLAPVLFSSDGKGSYHVICVFSEPVAGADVCAFGRWTLSQCCVSNGQVEVFPKQPASAYGSWLRLAGRHPKHKDHWHRAWDGGWLDAERTVNLILATEGAGVAPVLDRAHQLPPPELTQTTATAPPGIPIPPAEWIQKILDEGAEVGSRNQKTFLAAADLWARGHSEDQIVELIEPVMLRCGLESRGIRRTIESACSKPREPAMDDGAELVKLSVDRFSKKPAVSSAQEPLAEPASVQLAVDEKPVAPAEAEPFLIKRISDLTGSAADVPWIWRPYCARGCVSLLSSYPKAGKSTLIAHVVSLFGTGGVLVGPVTPGTVLIVSEEPELLWSKRRDELGLADHIHVLATPFLTRPTMPEWVKFLSWLADKVDANGYSLVCFDTLGRFLATPDESDASKTVAALSPIQLLTDRGCAVLLSHHLRKSGGSEGTAARGSGVIVGYADFVMELKRLTPEDLDDCRRTLSCLSRFDQVDEAVLELADIYKHVGTVNQAKQADRAAALLDLLRSGPPGDEAGGIHSRWPEPRPGLRTIRRDLSRMADELSIHRSGSGRSGDPYRFWR